MGTALLDGGFAEPIDAPNLITAVYFDGITQSPSGYSIDPSTGLLTFSTPPGTGSGDHCGLFLLVSLPLC